VTDLVYVYAIVAAAPAIRLQGINGMPVRSIVEGDLMAAVSDVPEDEFGEEPLNAGLADMHWLGPRAVAHQEVNQHLHDAVDALIPLAFGAVFRDDARVRGMLRDRQSGLRERLARVRNRAEWVVAVHRAEHTHTFTTPALDALQSEIDAASPGRAHLLKRRYAELERDEMRRVERETVDKVVEALHRVADDVYVEPLPAEVVDRPLLRASVLVPRTAEARFVDLIDTLGGSTYRVLVTGPWPPYRFGGLEHAAATR
jgi:Gas vesicle synthesis protein GvpL/GvpF